MKSNQKEELVRSIIGVVIPLINKNGKALKVDNMQGIALSLEYEGFNFIYSTPFSKLETFPEYALNYGLDVWVKGEGKVLSVWWEPFDLVCFKHGDWIDKLLQNK